MQFTVEVVMKVAVDLVAKEIVVGREATVKVMQEEEVVKTTAETSVEVILAITRVLYIHDLS